MHTPASHIPAQLKTLSKAPRRLTFEERFQLPFSDVVRDVADEHLMAVWILGTTTRRNVPIPLLPAAHAAPVSLKQNPLLR